MNEDDYEVGCDLWCYLGNHKGELTKGTLIHKFEHYGQTLYVIEFTTGIEPVYECRTWETISDDGKRINMWKLLSKYRKQGLFS
jgi:hypothetical protein